MTGTAYTLNRLQLHTQAIRVATSSIIRRNREPLNGAVRRFDAYFKGLDDQSKSMKSNVQKLLATSFFNHWYSAFLLMEAGLLVDAVLCERNALEVLAFHWLVCLDASAAEDYSSGNIPKPVVVRKRLETLGANISHIREGYASGSEISHVGRSSERFHLRWLDDKAGKLMIGGEFQREGTEHWLQYLPALLDLFQRPMLLDK